MVIELEKINKLPIDQFKSTLSALQSGSPFDAVKFESMLSLAINLLSQKIRTIGGQAYRIILITDETQFIMTDPIIDLAKTAEGLNIFIDVALFLHSKTPILWEPLQSLTKNTHGEFGYFANEKAFLRGLKGFASKKMIENNPLNLLSSHEKEDSKYLAEVAFPLRLPTEEESVLLKTQGRNPIKCQICFASLNPTNQQPFWKTGRYCPNCNTPFHLHCAGQWALKSEVAPNVFRCPFCYTLLRLPPSITKGFEIKKDRKFKSKKDFSGAQSTFNVKMVKSNIESLENTEEVCGFCFEPILSQAEDLKVFHCSSCNALYHATCLEKMYNGSKSCENCGGKIV